MTVARASLRQRADYTHKYNIKTGRHGWLRLTPAYSVKVVEEVLEKFESGMSVLDPFCGTATTALSAAYHGHNATTTDINPFLVWLGQAKTRNYSQRDILTCKNTAESILKSIKGGRVSPCPAPPIHNIERWWHADAIAFLQLLRASIEEKTTPQSAERDLLMVAFCRTLIKASNAAFNHQSMSFKDEAQSAMPFGVDMAALFNLDVHFIINGAAENPDGEASVLLTDARTLSDVNDKYNLVITSPPYVNRMSYIRELRPYMYWLEYLTSGKQAGELDWEAIGGTWGIATSRLNEWERPNDGFRYKVLDDTVNDIARSDSKNGKLLSIYVEKYFEDMWTHFNALVGRLESGAEVHYIVGNSTFYENVLHVEKIYGEMLRRLGFKDIELVALRKRNSKKELIEFDVRATFT